MLNLSAKLLLLMFRSFDKFFELRYYKFFAQGLPRSAFSNMDFHVITSSLIKTCKEVSEIGAQLRLELVGLVCCYRTQERNDA